MSVALKPVAGGGRPAAPRHFLELMDLDAATLRRMLDLGVQAKRGQVPGKPLAGKSVALIFEKPSTRTRVSFEVGIRQLGGDAIVLSSRDMQLGRGETPADTARVLSRYVDAIMLRTDNVAKIRELAEHATIPGNNVAQSFIQAAARFGFTLRLATPPELAPPARLIDWARAEGARIELTTDPQGAVAGARCVVTDTWVSMSDETAQEKVNRHNLLAPYQVNDALLRHAAPDAIVMHCLPAHRGEEITDAVMDGPQSVVFDEAENRLHAQKGVLLWALGLA
ncbi:MAG: ornithine carbamoyltransferase [Rhodospirillales bacterium 12-71-4]|nr:MAG: ornithine carbamoyltransferase [Rhodospirillales bacterium 12-71-4]